MKIFSRRSLSRKLISCRDLIRRKCETIFKRKQYKLEEEEEEVVVEEEEEGEGGGGEGEGGNEGRVFIKDLPDDVMQFILHRLPLSDYLSCRDVSPCWRVQIDSKRWLPAASHQLPWLLSFYYKDMQTFYIKTDVNDDDGDVHNYSFVSDRKIFKREIDYRYYGDYDYLWYCVGAIDGWLLMVSFRTSKDRRLVLLNPASAARVMLPSIPSSSPGIRKAVASSVPTTAKCYVTCLNLNFEGRSRLAFCMPSDNSWTLIEAEKTLGVSDIDILDDGKLYAVGMYTLDFVMVFDIHLDTHDSRLHTYTSQRLVTLHPTVHRIAECCTSCRRRCYLAKCSESKELFMILYNQDPGSQYQYFEFEIEFEGLFQVLKLEYNVTTGPQWVEIEDLGDRALFLGTLNNKFITPRDKTLEGNCIYFALWKQEHDRKELYSGVFSLKDKSTKPMTIPKHHPCGEGSATIWFTPTPWN